MTSIATPYRNGVVALPHQIGKRFLSAIIHSRAHQHVVCENLVIQSTIGINDYVHAETAIDPAVVAAR